LRKHLKANDDQWVKISGTRGDMETFGAKSYEKVEPRLDELEHNLGALKKVMKFTVEQGINDASRPAMTATASTASFRKAR
jgi:hypothetical protein